MVMVTILKQIFHYMYKKQNLYSSFYFMLIRTTILLSVFDVYHACCLKINWRIWILTKHKQTKLTHKCSKQQRITKLPDRYKKMRAGKKRKTYLYKAVPFYFMEIYILNKIYLSHAGDYLNIKRVLILY